MALTLIPSPNFIVDSLAIHLVKMSIPTLAMLYPNTLVIEYEDAIDEILMILPYPYFTISLPITRVGITVPNRFGSITFLIPSRVALKTDFSGGITVPGT